ncbi:hypothetical protein EG329_000807 [Mollisiaceae sp. DMI_Dod_QoI]|nr:hypothetical protein EG329_000807 [Helotiales sp. DMI_Dod_QoI]
MSTEKQLGSTDATERKRQKVKYNYSISASDIDQQTLVAVLKRKFGKEFRLKLKNDKFFLDTPSNITDDFLKEYGYYIDI